MGPNDTEKSTPNPPAPTSKEGRSVVDNGQRTRELFQYLVSTFLSLLPQDKAEQFAKIAHEIEAMVGAHSTTAAATAPSPPALIRQDPRRHRFLLRLVIGRVTPLFAGERPTMPRSLIEGIDRYLRKAFGPIIYDELNGEADQIFQQIQARNDQEMWDSIRRVPQMRRFVDTIFVRILFRFENFANGKKTFTHILDQTMQESARFTFGDDQFFAVFEALFADLWPSVRTDDQRLRWDFLFGDGTSVRIENILSQGLARWLRRQEGEKILLAGTAAAKRRQSAAALAGDAPVPAGPGKRPGSTS